MASISHVINFVVASPASPTGKAACESINVAVPVSAHPSIPQVVLVDLHEMKNDYHHHPCCINNCDNTNSNTDTNNTNTSNAMNANKADNAERHEKRTLE